MLHRAVNDIKSVLVCPPESRAKLVVSPETPTAAKAAQQSSKLTKCGGKVKGPEKFL